MPHKSDAGKSKPDDEQRPTHTPAGLPIIYPKPGEPHLMTHAPWDPQPKPPPIKRVSFPGYEWDDSLEAIARVTETLQNRLSLLKGLVMGGIPTKQEEGRIRRADIAGELLNICEITVRLLNHDETVNPEAYKALFATSSDWPIMAPVELRALKTIHASLAKKGLSRASVLARRGGITRPFAFKLQRILDWHINRVQRQGWFHRWDILNPDTPIGRLCQARWPMSPKTFEIWSKLVFDDFDAVCPSDPTKHPVFSERKNLQPDKSWIPRPATPVLRRGVPLDPYTPGQAKDAFRKALLKHLASRCGLKNRVARK
jgi:hypothetical protein